MLVERTGNWLPFPCFCFPIWMFGLLYSGYAAGHEGMVGGTTLDNTHPVNPFSDKLLVASRGYERRPEYHIYSQGEAWRRVSGDSWK